MAANRKRIPKDMEAEVLFLSDFTCCVCRKRGKTVQIHHIDGDPSNNASQNLAVLCLECHQGTQIRGGFGRRLAQDVVIKYRDDWLGHVQFRRTKADELAIQAMAGHQTQDSQTPQMPLLTFLSALPNWKAEALRRARVGWETGIAGEATQASYHYIDCLEAILVQLTGYYPIGHFGDTNTLRYFSSLTSHLFQWHRAALEPNGSGTGGTLVHTLACGAVSQDLERMVVDLVRALGEQAEDFDFANWLAGWRSSGS